MSVKTFAKHFPHYLLLFGILLAGFAGLILFSYDAKFQMFVAVATAITYVVWGIIHHYLRRDLHLEVIIEYVVVSALGLIVLLSLILR